MTTYDEILKRPGQQIATQEVFKYLLEMLHKDSVQDTKDWVEYGKLHCSVADLDEAILDVKQLLEAIKIFA